MTLEQAQSVLESYEVQTNVSVNEALANIAELEADIASALSQDDLNELRSNQSH